MAKLRRASSGVLGRDIPKSRGLSAHHHTGKVLAHHHTSYPALIFLILLSTVLAAAVAISGQAASSIISVTVQGPPPSVAATISQPFEGDRFTTANQTVRGTCPNGLGVEIYRNGAFAGSTLCDISGLYSVLVTLESGENQLVARDVDALGQYGPDSSTVAVSYDPPLAPSPTPVPAGATGNGPAKTLAPRSQIASPSSASATKPAVPEAAATAPLIVDSPRHFSQGSPVDAPVEWSINISGGQAPYRINWNWGDSATDNTTAQIPGIVTMSHTYARPGVFLAIARVKDARQHEVVMQTAMVINGAGGTGTGGSATRDAGSLALAWPALGLTTLVVACFWLGERYRLGLAREAARVASGAR